jgi:hypothetical protein
LWGIAPANFNGTFRRVNLSGLDLSLPIRVSAITQPRGKAMALSNAEHQRRFRERKKKAREAAPDLSGVALSRPFSDFIGPDRILELDENLDSLGVRITDSNFLRTEVQRFESEFARDEPLTALERAEALVGAFINAANELATLVSLYKREEIDRQLPSARGAQRLKLQQLRKALEKRTSHFFPVIKVKGD